MGRSVTEDPDRRGAASSTTPRHARPSSSSSTATTSPTARSSRCPRSSRRPRACRPNALLGFTNMLFKLLTDYRPKAVAVAWDSRPTHRTAVAEAADVVYKEGRRPMPDLLREQFPSFRPIVEAFGYQNLEFEGWEADDVIATLSTRADARGHQHVRRLDRPRRLPALLGEHLADDDPARGRRRQRLHARARRGALRGAARSGARLHRPQGRHLRQHPGRPGDRRQDGGRADRALRRRSSR